MSEIKAVTFDCWGTLITDVDYKSAMNARQDALAMICRLEPAEADALLDQAWRVHHRAWLEGVQYGSSGIARYCLQELGADHDLLPQLQEALEEAGRLGTQQALDGALDTLRTLRRAGVRTALVCDAGFTPGRIVRDFLDQAGLLDHLEYCAFSNEVGVPKPNPSIFQAALESIETDPGEAVHVGDLLRTDIWGARNLGMRTIRITAIGDDLARGFSWDPNAAFATDQHPDGSAAPAAAPYEDADEVVASHHELPQALRRLGTSLA